MTFETMDAVLRTKEEKNHPACYQFRPKGCTHLRSTLRYYSICSHVENNFKLHTASSQQDGFTEQDIRLEGDNIPLTEPQQLLSSLPMMFTDGCLKEEGMLRNGKHGPVPSDERCVAAMKFKIS